MDVLAGAVGHVWWNRWRATRDGPAFAREHPKIVMRVLERLGHHVAAVREQAVVVAQMPTDAVSQ